MSIFLKWQKISNPGFLALNEVHLYQLNLRLAPEKKFFDVLNRAEKARAAKFVFEKDRVRFIQTRGQLRHLCGRYLSQNPIDINFEYGEHGKPEIRGSDLKFNVSHSHDLALYGFMRHHDIGVDVEYVKKSRDLEGIAKRFFSRQEQVLLEEVPQHEYEYAFYTIWTRKEAYIKATGQGLTQSLASFSVNLATPAKFLHLPPGERCMLFDADVEDDNYVGACAIKILPMLGPPFN